MANVLDAKMPKFVVEEIKTGTTQMSIGKKKNEDAANPWAPFDDEISFNFYK